MFLTTVTDAGSTPALVKTLAYNQARLDMIARNVANIHTPGYRAKHLDPAAFQEALGKALRERGGDARKPLIVNAGSEVRTNEAGRLEVTPSERPVQNILFHDGTNLSIEREMAALAETGMTHELAATMLRSKYQTLQKAIRGSVA